MSAAPVVHIGGWPGAGKATIGRLVADALNARLIHNHLFLDPARALYARSDPQMQNLRDQLRALVFDHAAALPGDVPLVLTDALADEPASDAIFAHTSRLAQTRGAALHCFVLQLSEAENLRRLSDVGRRGGSKLTDPDILRDLRANVRLFVPQGAQMLDVTHLSAEQAATHICEHVKEGGRHA